MGWLDVMVRQFGVHRRQTQTVIRPAPAADISERIETEKPDNRPLFVLVTTDGRKFYARANTKSESRSEFKRILGVERLPTGCTVNKEDR